MSATKRLKGSHAEHTHRHEPVTKQPAAAPAAPAPLPAGAPATTPPVTAPADDWGTRGDDHAHHHVEPEPHGHVPHPGGFELGTTAAVTDHSFATTDASATQAMATLTKAFADPKFKALLGTSTLTTADLSSIARRGTLRGQALDQAAPALAADLVTAAKFLNATSHRAYRTQLAPKLQLTPASVAAAQTAGFHDPHAAILKTQLRAFARHAADVAPAGKTEHAFTLAELKTMVDSGTAPSGKTLKEAIPSASVRTSFVNAVKLIVANEAVFTQLDLSGRDPMPSMAMTDGKFTVTDLNRLTGANGEKPLPNRPTFEKLVEATLQQVAPPYFERVEIHKLDAAKRAELAKAYTAWADETNMVPHHEAWHTENGSGGTKGKGSGEKFMQFHAQMGEEFKEWLLAQEPPRTELFDEHGLLPNWDTTQPLPKEFWEGTAKHSIDWRLPAFLDTTARKGETMTLDGRVIASLNDIHTPDEFGRVWGESGAHAVAHNRLGDEMAGFASVRDPAFLLWHFGVIEANRALWMTTDSGKAWLKEHPSGWTDPDADAGHVMSMAKPRGIEGMKGMMGATRGPPKPFWGDDQLREAGVGFTDATLRTAAATRVQTESRPT